MAIASVKVRRARPLLGTFVEIEAVGRSEAETVAAVDAAFAAVAKVHELMSFHAPDSDVSRLNREACLRPVKVHAWTHQVLEAAVEMHRRSKGVFDVAVAQVLQSLGLLPRTHVLPAACAERRLDAIELLPEQTIRYREADIAIDLGGIAKGFAVDRALEVLQRFGIPGGIVNAGGDLAAFGPFPQTVHVRHPRHPSQLVCSVEVANEALASSARRCDPFFSVEMASSAVIDPFSQRPSQIVDGATVRASCCMIADALTKVVMIAGAGAGELLEHYGASALVISPDSDIQITSDWSHAVHLAA